MFRILHIPTATYTYESRYDTHPESFPTREVAAHYMKQYPKYKRISNNKIVLYHNLSIDTYPNDNLFEIVEVPDV